MPDELEIVNYDKKTIEDLLAKQDVQYSVSYFQRDYSWEKDNWVALFDDILGSMKEKRKHFFGFMTFFRPAQSNELQIIEGQQRLATVTILASVIRDILRDKNDYKWKEIDASFIKPKDIYSDKSYDKLVLSDIDRDFFKENIQKEGNPREKIDNMKKKRLKTSNKLIRDCYKYFFDNLKDEHLLLEMLRQATREFIVISSEVKNLRSAYILFQTLNDRGLDLTLSDLLKTHLFDKAGDDWRDVKRDWDHILNLPEINNMNVFLRHYWLSTRGVVKEDELFDKFSDGTRNKEDAMKFVDGLKKEADIYSMLLEPKPSDFGANRAVAELLTNKLYVLSKQQVLPLLLALVPKFDRKPTELTKVVEALIVFIFRYLTIGEQENKELERLFSEIARGIREDKIDNASSVVKELRKIDIEDEIFKSQFRTKQIKQNQRAIYILKEIEQFLSQQDEKFFANITLEHIIPVNPSDECEKEMRETNTWDDKDELIYRLGNMTLLLDKPNKRAQNRPPSWKSKNIYNKETKLEINRELKNIAKWASEDIEKRQTDFADYAVKIWKL